MTFRRSPLSRSLMGIERTCSVALHTSAFDPKSSLFAISTQLGAPVSRVLSLSPEGRINNSGISRVCDAALLAATLETILTERSQITQQLQRVFAACLAELNRTAARGQLILTTTQNAERHCSLSLRAFKKGAQAWAVNAERELSDEIKRIPTIKTKVA